MIISKMNQLMNAGNPYQGSRTKALCVCSAGLLRSTTIAGVLYEKGYNVRNCGMSQEYALIPISTALVQWADEIHVVKEHYDNLLKALESAGISFPEEDIYVYDIPDIYEAFDPKLREIIEDELSKT
jgi:predicted protein tyrosine phosphatase